ncbi:MAG: hypothetical protein ACRES7_08885 [Gammaproteobacteria bacterium]
MKATNLLKALGVLFIMAGGSAGLALSGGWGVGQARAGEPAAKAATPNHAAGQTLPAALRPVFYQSLAKDAGPAYALNAKGCATLPKQTLTACFDAAGAHFNSKGAAPLALHLVGVGRGNELAAVATVQPAITGNRVSYAHDNLTEWWRVLSVGFEQGFTLAKRPHGAGELTLALASRIVAPAQAGAQSKESLPTQGRDTKSDWIPASAGMTKKENTLAFGKLRYGQLVVTDANGKVVPATMKSEGDRILIAVNDAQAVYPLTVDPLVWLEQKVTVSDGAAYDSFGYSAALSGNTALVSATGGAAYVFTESGGTWTQTAKLTASDGGDGFGNSVAIDGTTALVGAWLATVNDYEYQGAVYVFTDSGGEWSQTAKLTASDAGVDDQWFGASAALSGTTALVGASGDTVNGNSIQGAAYVFTESGGTWTQTQKLTASDGAAQDSFGNSVALDGTTAVVGANETKVNGNYYQGAAYVFSEVGGTWTQAAKLTASDGAMGDEFGSSVALVGGTALVGAEVATVNGKHAQGAAYVFSEAGGTWTQTQKLIASDGVAGDEFGTSVALAGSTVLVGAFNATVNGNDYQGAAYVFSNSDGSWSQTQKFTAIDGAADDYFGSSVALAGTTALVGADGATVNSNVYQGAAYFEGESDLGLAVSAPQTVGQNQTYVSQTIATNNASAASPAVSATMTVPAAASFISAMATQGSCSEASGVVTCDFGSINGNAGTATANVTLKATGAPGTMIDNTASIAKATPPLTASAPTGITGAQSCPDSYTAYTGTLGSGASELVTSYAAPAGEENAILYASTGFGLYARVDSAHGRWEHRFPGTEVHRWGPAGTYSWGVKAGNTGGAYTFCIQHP